MPDPAPPDAVSYLSPPGSRRVYRVTFAGGGYHVEPWSLVKGRRRLGRETGWTGSARSWSLWTLRAGDPIPERFL